MVHAFTSAGMLPSQYEEFCHAASLGCVNEHYVQDGMLSFPRVFLQGLMIDARYDSVRSAYHTTVTAISMS